MSQQRLRLQSLSPAARVLDAALRDRATLLRRLVIGETFGQRVRRRDLAVVRRRKPAGESWTTGSKT
jgi:hypothetical protein